MAGKIFISYRRDDEQPYAVRLFERLAERFGRKEIFFDIDSIPYGSDFAGYIGNQIALSSVVLVVIGKDWLDARQADGRRRLENPDDFVRVEIELALKQDKLVVPILVMGTPMPRAKQLPRKMQALAGKHAFPATHVGFTTEIPKLVERIENALLIGKKAAFDPGAMAGNALSVLGTKGKAWLKPLEARVSEVAKGAQGPGLSTLKSARSVVETRTREWLQSPPVRPEFLVPPAPETAPSDEAPREASAPDAEAAAEPSVAESAESTHQDGEPVPDLRDPDLPPDATATATDAASDHDHIAARAQAETRAPEPLVVKALAARTQRTDGQNPAQQVRPAVVSPTPGPKAPPARIDPRDKPVWRVMKYIGLAFAGIFLLVELLALFAGR